MPRTRVNDIDVYYEVHGSGTPLLWIGGLGANVCEIPYLVESYGRHFQFIAYDARGNGRSDKPPGDYSIAGYADDAAGLLEALGLDGAFVYGSSMGGMVAQELTLRHAVKVRALILGCTTAGAIRGVRPAAETVERMVRNQGLVGEEALEAGWSLGYSRAYIAANRQSLLERSRSASQFSAPRDSYMRQILAAAQHDTYDRLHQIECPVLIIHGADDLQIPVGNAHLMKERLSHAEMAILEGLGHGYNLEGQAQADAIVIDFLQRQVAPARGVADAVR